MKKFITFIIISLLFAVALPGAITAFAGSGEFLGITITAGEKTVIGEEMNEITVLKGETVKFEVVASIVKNGKTDAFWVVDGIEEAIVFDNGTKEIAKQFQRTYHELGEYIIEVSVYYGKETPGNGQGNYDFARHAIIVYVIEENVEDVLLDAWVSASVVKDKGNTNTLTITVVETWEILGRVEISKVFTIANNAIGTYQVENYRVYVDTKGNVQVRECYFVE
ncbi:MAG: hypothetical protein FWE84_03925 [Firmicutes bacterium]|nr:hypothetical protein [Bacillota bacterium]